MHSNFVKRLLKAAWVLELVVAVLILAVTLLELFLLGEGTLSQVLGGSFSADAFFADAMTIVVGIEFVKMLMLHHSPGGHRRAALCHRPAACGQPLQRGGHPAGRGRRGPDLRHQEVSPHRRG